MNNHTPYEQLKIPTGMLMRELYTACSVVPSSVIIGSTTYPVNFNLNLIVPEAIAVAGDINSTPGAMEKYIMQLQATSLYLLTDELQKQISTAVIKFINGIYNIIILHSLLDLNAKFRWRYLNMSTITFDITLIRI